MTRFLKIISLISFFCFGNLLAQTSDFSIDLEESSCEEVFAKLQSEFGLNCTYDPAILKTNIPKGSYVGESFEDLLRSIAESAGLEIMHNADESYSFRSASGVAGSSFTLSGRVSHATENTPMSSASIITYPDLAGTYSDENGDFLLVIDENVEEIWVKFMGYEVQKFKPEKGMSLDVQLKESATDMDEVVICHKLPLQGIESGATQFAVKKINLLPRNAGFVDILQGVQYTAGVSAINDGYGNISIRGSHSSEALVLLDNIPIIQMDHYFGLFSTLPSDVVEDATLYKRHTPSTYGSKSAGLLDLSSLKRPKRNHGAVYTGLLGSGAWLNISPGKNGRSQLVLSGRISNGAMGQGSVYEWMSDLREKTIEEVAGQSENLRNLTAETPTVKFNDLFAKYSYEFKVGTELSVSAFRSAEEYDNSFTWKAPSNSGQGGGSGSGMPSLEDYREESSWESSGVGLQVIHEWKTGFSSELSLSLSKYQREQSLRISLPGAMGGQEVRDDQTNMVDWQRYLWNNRLFQRSNFKVDLGAELDVYDVDAKIKNQGANTFTQDNRAFESSVFGHVRWELPAQFYLQAGLRGSYYDKTEKFYWQPRVLLEYKPVQWLNLYGSIGRYYQFLREISHEDRYGQPRIFWVNAEREPFPVLNSKHYNLGVDLNYNFVTVAIEFYQKEVRGLSEFANNATGFDQNGNGGPQGNMYQSFVGDGLLKGMDFSLNFQKGGFSNWLSYTLSSSEQRFKEIYQNRYFPAANDRLHQFKLASTFKRNAWTLSGTYVFASGAPYTDISNHSQSSSRNDLRPEDRLSYFDDYHRINLAARYDFKWRSLAPWIELSVYNLTDHQNINALRYLFLNPGGSCDNCPPDQIVGAEIQGLGRTLNVQLGVAF